MAAVLQAHRLGRTLPGVTPVVLVQDIDLAIDRGEFVAITGPSGSGKSSLLYLLGLLDEASSGQLLVDGKDASHLDASQQAALRLEKLGFVFQFHFLLPEFTALENIMLPMRRLGRLSDKAMRDRARQLLADLQLEQSADKRPDQMSGGHRQRVAIARALANEPVVILADEPTGNLDSHNGQIVFDIFRRLTHEQGQTVVTVTHDAHLAGQTDRQIQLVDGRIQS